MINNKWNKEWCFTYAIHIHCVYIDYVHSVQCTLYSVHCTLYNVHYIICNTLLISQRVWCNAIIVSEGSCIDVVRKWISNWM